MKLRFVILKSTKNFNLALKLIKLLSVKENLNKINSLIKKIKSRMKKIYISKTDTKRIQRFHKFKFNLTMKHW